MKTREEQKSNIKIALIFLAFVCAIIVISFLIKGVILIRESIYDTSQRFNLEVSNAKKTKVMSFSGMEHEVSVLTVEGEAFGSVSSIGIPLDGFLRASFLNPDGNIPEIFLAALLRYTDVKTNLSVLDLLKLLLYSATTSENSSESKTISLSSGPSEIDKALGRFFVDEMIEKEKDTIEIVNGTDVVGLGNRAARLIVNMGGDVVIVGTSDAPVNNSYISYVVKKDYTVERLSKLLGFPIVKRENKGLTDISIMIGKDKLSTPSF